MNSLKKELKAVIENQNKFNEEISAMKARIQALESKTDNNVEVQIDNLMEGIQYQRDVIENKLKQIDASIKKIDEELEALAAKAFTATEVSDNAHHENAPASEVRCDKCSFSCMQPCDMKKHMKFKDDKFCNKEGTICGKIFM